MKVGDLVKMKNAFPRQRRRIGIIFGWYDTPKNMVTVRWWHAGELKEMSPCHVSKLEVISESR
jgi:hypothetical protein